MCGIVGGYIQPGNEPIDAELARRMTARLRHRGPDDEGLLFASHGPHSARASAGTDTVSVPAHFPFAPQVSDLSPHRIDLFLGHRRLSIRDLSAAGHQPMCTEDRRFWIVFNGEIYNADEVSRRIVGPGARFGTSDTEVLLRGFALHGEAVLQELNGMFAFAIWDDHEKTLFLARDRLGIKPLYITRCAAGLWFASEIKALLMHPEIEAVPEWSTIYYALGLGPGARPSTWFADIEALAPGTWLRVDANGGAEQGRYWSAPIGHGPQRSYRDASAELGQRLSGAVERRLVSDVPVGVYLSGGVDSSLVAAYARRAGGTLSALTLGFGQSDDETEAAHRTARYLGMDHRVIEVTPARVLDDAEDRILWDEEPGYGLGPNDMMAEFARQEGFTVVLNGLGGDELFAGYGYYRLAQRWGWTRLARHLPGLRHWLARRNPNDALLFELECPMEIQPAQRSLVSDADKAQLFPEAMVPPIPTPAYLRATYCPAGAPNWRDPIQALSYMDLMNYVGNHHLVRGDQYSMRHSVEARFPFLDHLVVEFALGLPAKFKIRGGIHKRILRDLLAQQLPEYHTSGPKRGFSLPLDGWLRGPLREFARDMLARLDRRRLFCPGGIDHWWQRFEQGTLRPQALWQLVMMERWLTVFIDQRGECARARDNA